NPQQAGGARPGLWLTGASVDQRRKCSVASLGSQHMVEVRPDSLQPRRMLDAELVLGAGRSHHEERRLSDGPRMNPIPVTVPAAVPSGRRPLPPETPTGGEPAGH